MLKLKKIVFNPFQENTYILWDEQTGETAIVDPGVSNNHEEIILDKFVIEKKLKVKYLLNTHCHVDHIIGNKFVKEKYNCKFYAPEKDIPLLEQLPQQTEKFGLKKTLSPHPDEFLEERKLLKLGEIKIKSLYTPGHTPGEFCFLVEDEDICITGDVLFRESIGRTDLWGGNYQTLIVSIKEKLFTLKDDISVYPGHGKATTIGYEKINNPFLT